MEIFKTDNNSYDEASDTINTFVPKEKEIKYLKHIILKLTDRLLQTSWWQIIRREKLVKDILIYKKELRELKKS